jgi:hypothetical protein
VKPEFSGVPALPATKLVRVVSSDTEYLHEKMDGLESFLQVRAVTDMTDMT